MRGMQAHLFAQPETSFKFAVMAYLLLFGAEIAGTLLFWRYGRTAALTAGLISGTRTITLAWVVLGDKILPLADLFLATSMIAKYTAPGLTKWLLAPHHRGRGFRRGRRTAQPFPQPRSSGKSNPRRSSALRISTVWRRIGRLSGYKPALTLAVWRNRGYIGLCEAASRVRSHISPGPYRSFRELSLAGSVDPVIWCPPTFVGAPGSSASTAIAASHFIFCSIICCHAFNCPRPPRTGATTVET